MRDNYPPNCLGGSYLSTRESCVPAYLRTGIRHRLTASTPGFSEKATLLKQGRVQFGKDGENQSMHHVHLHVPYASNNIQHERFGQKGALFVCDSHSLVFQGWRMDPKFNVVIFPSPNTTTVQVWDRSPFCRVGRWAVHLELERTN